VRRSVDALRFAAAIVTWPISRRLVQARGDESRRELPGDDLLPEAKGKWTNAITIRARASDIWPWLVQMGCRRGGWYSYDGLDNGGVPSAERIVAELQHVARGDLFPWTPDANDGFIVKAVEPGRVLVLGGDAGSLYQVIWAFILEPLDESRTRLLTRAAANYERRSVGLGLRLTGHPMHFAMQRRQLLNVRRRAEALANR
jgi:proline iminopeptidase